MDNKSMPRLKNLRGYEVGVSTRRKPGGFSNVYDAVDTKLGTLRKVKIKELFPEGSSRDESGRVIPAPPFNSPQLWQQAVSFFLEDANELDQFGKEPGIVDIIERFEENNTAYIVMKWAGDLNLREYVEKRPGGLPEPEARRIIGQIAEALSSMHGRETFHRDLKPSNVVINDKGNPVLIDFGDSRWRITQLVGGLDEVQYDAQYTAPELVEAARNRTPNEAHATEDIYSLGATFYFMLTGHAPPTTEPPLPRNISSGSRRALKHALKRDSNARPQQISEFLTDVRDRPRLPGWAQAGLGLIGAVVLGVLINLLTNAISGVSIADLFRQPTATVVASVSPAVASPTQNVVVVSPTAVAQVNPAPPRVPQPTALPSELRCTEPALQAKRVSSDNLTFKSLDGPGTMLNGRGATFPAIFYQLALPEFKRYNGNLEVYYACSGSGSGVSAIVNNAVDFGAADYQDASLTNSREYRYLQVPVVLGAVAVLVNMPNTSVSQHLNLSPATLNRIYRGEIKNWNDPAIAADNQDNPTMQGALPDAAIIPVYRRDPSGTTRAVSDYLYRRTGDPYWQNKPAFPTVPNDLARAEEGNGGVILAVRTKPYAIGYVEVAYLDAVLDGGSFPVGVSYSYLQNGAGQYVEPTWESVRAAAEAARLTSSLGLDFNDVRDGYPITAASYILIHRDYSDSDSERYRAVALANLLRYLLTEGQTYLSNNKRAYAALPDNVRQQAMAAVCTMTVGGESVCKP